MEPVAGTGRRSPTPEPVAGAGVLAVARPGL